MIFPQPAKHRAACVRRGAPSAASPWMKPRGIDGRVPTISAVSGEVRGNVQAVYGHNNVSTNLQGAMPGYEDIYFAPPRLRPLLHPGGMHGSAHGSPCWAPRSWTGLFGTANPVGRMDRDQSHSLQGHRGAALRRAPTRTEATTTTRSSCRCETAMYRVLGKKYVDWIDTSASDPDRHRPSVDQLQDLTTGVAPHPRRDQQQLSRLQHGRDRAGAELRDRRRSRSCSPAWRRSRSSSAASAS